MAVSVLVPTPLRNLTQGKDTVEVEAAHVAARVDGLEAQ